MDHTGLDTTAATQQQQQHDPEIPLLGNPTPEEAKIGKDTCIPLFIAALLTVAKSGSHLDIHLQIMDKEAVVHTYSGILLSHEKECI